MTVAELRAALAAYPDAMPVAVRTMQAPDAEDAEDVYCIAVDEHELAVRDIWHEDEGGYTYPAADSPAPVPTLIINNGYEV